ncbi:MAG: hypothetical protein HONBIEJF_02291 [Fimbriimonadaceae bacterium]|nr:hypothetical protein [Fimbriimonadaceae bacterium]
MGRRQRVQKARLKAYRILVGFASALATLVPVGILTYLCVDYLHEVFQEIIKPGHSLAYEYESASGPVRLHVESFSWEASPLRATAELITLTDSKGQQPLRVRSATAALVGKRIDVLLDRVTGIVTRTTKERFDFQDLTPKTEGPKSDYAISLVATQIDLTYRDLVAKETRLLSIPRARAEILQDDWAATATVIERTLGRVPVVANGTTERQDFRIRLTGSELASWIPMAKTWLDEETLAEFGNSAAERLTVSGAARLTLRSKRTPTLWTEFSAAGTGLTLGNYVTSARADLSAAWTENGGRFKGTVGQQGFSSSIDGLVRTGDPLGLSLNFIARTDRKESMPPWLRDLLPRELIVRNADMHGALTVRGDSFAVVGPVVAQRAVWDGEPVENVRGRLYADNNRVRFHLEDGVYGGSHGSGFVTVEAESNTVTGSATFPRLDLAEWGDRLGFPDISGSGRGIVSVSGKSSNPVITFQSEGSVVFHRDGDESIDLGNYEARLELVGDQLQIKRAAISGPTGVMVASGSANVGRRILDISFEAGGVEIGKLSKDLQGIAFGSGELTGSFDRPKGTGRLQLYGLEWNEQVVPVLQTAWTLSADGQVIGEDVKAILGSAEATGTLTWNSETGDLGGRLNLDQVEISDFTKGAAIGRASLSDVVLSGTVEHPRVSANLKSDRILVEGISFNGIAGEIAFDRGTLLVESASATLGGGKVSLSGSFDLETAVGTGTATLVGVPLEQLPLKDLPINLSGQVGGKVDVSIREQQILSLNAALDVDDLQLNRALVGSGTANVSVRDGVWHAEAEVGQLAGFISVKDLEYRVDDDTIAMKLESLNFPLETYTAAFSNSFENLDLVWQERILGATGTVTAAATIQGPARGPDVDLSSLQLNNIVFAGRGAGDLSISGSRVGSVWTIRDAKLQDDEAVISASGTYDEAGPVAIDSAISNFDLSWLQTLAPEFPKTVGTVEGVVKLGGAKDDIQASGSIGTQGMVIQTSEEAKVPMALLIEQFDVKGGQLSANGTFSIDDFSGRIEAQAPIAAFGRPPDERPAGEPNPRAKLTLAPRELRDIARDATGIDFTRSSGQVSGEVLVEWQPQGAYLDGAVRFAGSQIYFKDFEQGILNPQLTVGLKGQSISVTGQGDGSAGGKIGINLAAKAPDQLRFNQPIEDLLAQVGIEGAVIGHNLRATYTEPKSKARSSIAMDVDARIAGTALSPVLSGKITTGSGDLAMPAEIEQGGTKPDWLIDPIVQNFRVETAPGTTLRVRTGETTMDIMGGLNLRGSATVPTINGDFEVERGQIRLPTARVTVEPGGRLALTYESRPDGTVNSRVDVNLVGRTAITARRFDDQIERYDITLEMDGNLLVENGLRMRASSDPPDLTNDQILGLIGQKSLLEAINPTSLQQGEAFRELFYGYAIPTLTDPITRNLAQSLGLDYLNLEYNQFEQASISLARTLGPGLVLSARRQISPPRFGERQRYEVKLTYRPRVPNRLLSRLRFSVGLDQDRPWKIGIDYTIRF